MNTFAFLFNCAYGNLGPKDMTPGSPKKIWWLCEKGHWWQASVRCRTRGMRVPIA